MKSMKERGPLQSNKILMVGNSGAGKTGSILELVKDGFDVKIADFDDKASDLITKSGILTQEQYENHVFLEAFRETSESQAQAYKNFKKFLDGDDSPFTWDEKSIFVVDSLTYLGKAIQDSTKRDNPQVKDGRQLYGMAQDELDRLLSRLTASSLKCHVILIAHLKYQDIYAGADGVPSETQAFPNGIGQARNQFIPAGFNTMLEVQAKKGKRYIKTQPSRFIQTKIPVLAAKGLKEEYPIEDGMREIFKLLTPSS